MKSLAISLMLMVLGGGTLSLPTVLQSPRKSVTPPKLAPAAPTVTTAKLEEAPRLTNIPSVTETTTRNLAPVLAEKPKQRE